MRTAVLILLYSFVPLRFPCTAVCPIMDIRPGVYSGGIGYLAAAGCAVSGLLFCLIGYRIWILGKEYGFQTPSDYLRERYYSEGFGLFVAILLVFFSIPYIAVQLITIGEGISVTTNGVFPLSSGRAFRNGLRILTISSEAV